MRFSLNLPCLYRGDAYDTVLESVRRSGYDTVECWTLPPEDEMKLVQALEKYHVHLAAFCPDFFILNDPHVRLLFDIYHQLHMKEDVQARIFDNLPLIGHFHVAGYPRRDEAIFETYDYAPLFDVLEAAGCRVPIGLELRPSCSQAREKLLQQVLHWQDPQN